MSNLRPHFSLWLGTLASLMLGCTPAPQVPVGTEPGAPLPGLRPLELARFEQGKTFFDHVFTPEEGLGPLFNENQCSACHTDPVSGGTGEQRVLKASRVLADGRCDFLAGERGQNIRQQATALIKRLGVQRETPPPEATALGRFSPPFLFGLGLLEAIPEAELLKRADPTDRDGDGISGRPGRTPDGALGRFGRKADIATLTDFVATALRLEMGLTSPLQPREAGLNGEPLPSEADPVPDPEVPMETLQRLVDFVRFLAPLAPEPLAADARRDSVVAGGRIFQELGCPSCHVPSMITGRSAIPALDRKRVFLYSDLLLHDMGPELADVCSVGAEPSELRTEPLAGLRFRKAFLHDGRARSVRDAILLHGGEAAKARARFGQLDWASQLLLLRFLDSL